MEKNLTSYLENNNKNENEHKRLYKDFLFKTVLKKYNN